MNLSLRDFVVVFCDSFSFLINFIAQYQRGVLVRPPSSRAATSGSDWTDWQCLPHTFHQCGEIHHSQISIFQSKYYQSLEGVKSSQGLLTKQLAN